MNFGTAIELLKNGKRVGRTGWNGKDMYLFLIPGSVVGSLTLSSKATSWTYTNGVDDNMPVLPFIAMRTADGKVVPWLASQTDMLSEDWLLCAPMNEVVSPHISGAGGIIGTSGNSNIRTQSSTEFRG